jgi:hypothetical protein
LTFARAEKAEAERDELRARLSADTVCGEGAASAKASRYDWRDAKPWERFRSTDKNGNVFRWDAMPYAGDVEWLPGELAEKLSSIMRLRGPIEDWEQSLEPRPKGTEGASTADEGGSYSSMDYGNAMVETSDPTEGTDQ